MEAAKARLADLQVDQQTTDILNKNLKDYQGRPGAIDYGGYAPEDPNGLINLTKRSPGAMDDYLGKNNRKTAIVRKPDGQLHVIGYNADAQISGTTRKWKYLITTSARTTGPLSRPRKQPQEPTARAT